jgi:transposase
VILLLFQRYLYGGLTWLLVVRRMLKSAENLSDDPAELRAMIAALQSENARIEVENAKLSATLRVHDQLVQALRLRIAKLQKLAFGKSSEKIEREIEQLELALEDLLVAVAEEDDAPIDEGQNEPSPEITDARTLRRRPRVSDATLRERRELDLGTCCPDCGGDLRVVGEDVSELLDMIAAQMKVLQIARIKKSCRRCEKMVQEPAPSRPSPAAWRGQTCWHTFWSPNLMTIFLYIANTKSSPAWARTSLKARLSVGVAAP